jgi:hypothetical protein
MIELYPVKIEAYEDGENLFKLESFDEHVATLTFDGLIHPGNVDEVFSAVRAGLKMLRLDSTEQVAHVEAEDE